MIKKKIVAVFLVAVFLFLFSFSLGISRAHMVKSMEVSIGWSEDVRLTFVTSSHRASSPAVDVNNDIVHVVYTNDTTHNIYYLRSLNAGRTWEKGKKISNITADGGCFNARIAVNVSNIHVVWDEIPDDGNTIEIYYVKSSDNGETWSIPTRLSDLNNSWSQWPDIAVWNDNVYVVWGDNRNDDQYEIYFKNSSDNGTTWSEDKRLTFYMSGTDGNPKIVVNDTNIHIVFHRYVGCLETFYMMSNDSGKTWSTPTVLSEDDCWNSYAGDIAVDNSNIHIIWEDYGDTDSDGYGEPQICYCNSTNNGLTWNPTVSIIHRGYSPDEPTHNRTEQPSMTIDGDSIYVAWIDNRDHYSYEDAFEIYCINSTDGGITWGSETRLTIAVNNSLQPDIAVTNDDIHLVWMDNRTGDTTDYEIYYKRYPKFNDPPVINSFYPLENLTITENQNISFMINDSDLDNDTLTFQWYLNSVPVGEKTPTYTFIANSTCSGVFEIKIVVSDNISSPVNHSWILTVINVGELYCNIADLQDQINQLNVIIFEFNETISNLSQKLALIWNELNWSVQNNSDLQNLTEVLKENLSAIWNLLNQSLEDNKNLTALIEQLNQYLNTSNEQITMLLNLLNQSKLNETDLQGIIFNLTENLTLAWELISTYWDLWNLSKMNETKLQACIDNLTENLTSAEEQISILWDLWNQSKSNETELQNLLNISKQNETNLLNQINELDDENEKLRNELNETKKTPWISSVETVIILTGLCIIMMLVRKKQNKRRVMR